MKRKEWIAGCILLLIGFSARGSTDAQPLDFSVVNQRSVTQTAEIWNPILAYVSKKSGVTLRLRMGRTAPETTEMTVRENMAFAYTNHLFAPERARLGYRAILRLDGPPIRGTIIARSDGIVHSEKDLDGLPVAFPSHEAFFGYLLPKAHFDRMGIHVRESFAGNQEGAISQIKFGKAGAAGINQKVLQGYVRRTHFSYRTIWTSEPYPDTPIMVHPAVPKQVVEAVRAAFLGMTSDAEGRKALQAAALATKEPWSFVTAEDRDYDKERRFRRNIAASVR